MARRSTVVIFLATVFICQVQSKSQVSLYYETHCPDSQRLMTEGLAKNLDLIDDVDYELVPYGKATTTKSGNSYSFTCQHGAKECTGNMYHACALDQHTDKKQVFMFAICTMSYGSRVLDKVAECARKSSIDSAKLEECVKGPKGGELLAKMGEKTEAAAAKINGGKKLDFVPSTLIDGTPKVFEAYDNLRNAICKNAASKPVKC